MFSPLVVFAIWDRHYGLAILALAGPVAMSMLFLLVYTVVRVLMNRVSSRLTSQPGTPLLHSDCVMVSGILQFPAVAEIRGETLILAPLIGKVIALPLETVSVKSETDWFNGKLLFGGARGFWLNVSERKSRLGFAVADAAAWRRILEKNHAA
jgi:hypothetical protein